MLRRAVCLEFLACSPNTRNRAACFHPERYDVAPVYPPHARAALSRVEPDALLPKAVRARPACEDQSRRMRLPARPTAKTPRTPCACDVPTAHVALFLFPQRRVRIRTPYVPRDKQPSATCTPNKRKRREPDGTIPQPTRPRPRSRPTRRRGTGRASPRARADTMTQRPRLLPPARRLASPRPYVSARGNVF